eukprot:TRINITY_DN11234_c0_g1_i1.p1 TRINITY_DN11234_c0_g1~~TRINITY_DN11234_c0_g1_i1.p1  ORF type:complete len:152 (-),score=27.44 TRINITY_DN11234_c0_g1_i1:4-459(-)
MSLSASDVVVGGRDRSVYVIDLMKHAQRAVWKNAIKYEITSLHLSRDPKLCFVSGQDSEIICGTWQGRRKKGANYSEDGIRADSRWIGLTYSAKHDLLVGVTQSGTLYTITNATGLNPTAQSNSAQLKRKLIDETDHRQLKKMKTVTNIDE